jgi:hypothetical protein
MTEQEFLEDLDKCITGMIEELSNTTRVEMLEKLNFVKYNIKRYREQDNE